MSLPEFLATWKLANWREYVQTSLSTAEGVLKQPLTPEEHKQLRRWLFRRFKEGTPGSSRASALVWIVMINLSRERGEEWSK